MVSMTMYLAPVVLVFLSPLVQTQDCPTPVAGCICQVTMMKCSDLNILPAQQDGITSYVFSDSQLGTALSNPLPYTEATTIEMINCGINGLTADAFKNTSKLELLEISSNQIQHIGNETFANTPKLRNLKLENNGIQLIEAGTLRKHYLPNLETLDLSQNDQLNRDNNFFVGISDTVAELDIDVCGIMTEFTEDLFKPFPNLKKLDIGGNHLHKIESQFSKLNKLEELYIYNCMVSEIDADAFDELKMLISIDLEHNELRELDEDTFEGPRQSLTTVYLKRNNFTSLHEELLPWEQLTSLDLTQNPWNCDCDISWMGATLSNISSMSGMPKCATPNEFRGHSVLNVTASLLEDDKCSNGLGTAALVIIIILLIGCTFLLAFLVYKCLMSNKRQAATSGTQYSAVYQQTNEPKKKGMLHEPV